MPSLPISIKRIESKQRRKCGDIVFHIESQWEISGGEKVETSFPHSVCHGNQSYDPICPKTLCSLFLNPVILHVQFDQDWPTGGITTLHTTMTITNRLKITLTPLRLHSALPFVDCRRFVYLVISLLVYRAGCGI